LIFKFYQLPPTVKEVAAAAAANRPPQLRTPTRTRPPPPKRKNPIRKRRRFPKRKSPIRKRRSFPKRRRTGTRAS
jgi:hypothetical protein